jgi:hypothetical protein
MSFDTLFPDDEKIKINNDFYQIPQLIDDYKLLKNRNKVLFNKNFTFCNEVGYRTQIIYDKIINYILTKKYEYEIQFETDEKFQIVIKTAQDNLKIYIKIYHDLVYNSVVYDCEMPYGGLFALMKFYHGLILYVCECEGENGNDLIFHKENKKYFNFSKTNKVINSL